MLCIPAGGTRKPLTPEAYAKGEQYLTMDGRGVFKWAVRIFEDSTRDVLEHASVGVQQIDSIIMHQANQRIIDSAVADLNVRLRLCLSTWIVTVIRAQPAFR